jgi:integrase
MSFSHKGERYRLSTGTANERLAERIYAKVRTEIETGAYFPQMPEHHKTVAELLEKYFVEHSALNKKPRAHRRDRSLKTHLIKAFGHLIMVDVTPAAIAAYKTARRQAGASGATVNRELGMARHAFNLAMKEWQWASRNPFTMVTREKEPKGRDRWLRDEEERRLLAACPAWLREFVEFAVETGLRLGEILTLQWPHVDLGHGTLTVEAATTKNGLPRTIPLSDRALAVLRRRQGRTGDASLVVFANRTGGHRTLGTVNRAFRKARTRAGIANCRFHDLRHTFATRLCQDGVDPYTVQRLVGHQDPKMTQRYAHHCTESLRRGIEVLNRRGTERLSRFCHAEPHSALEGSAAVV